MLEEGAIKRGLECGYSIVFEEHGKVKNLYCAKRGMVGIEDIKYASCDHTHDVRSSGPV